jgi:pimeloyl-ACP methyl ester carboxylesterase
MPLLKIDINGRRIGSPRKPPLAMLRAALANKQPEAPVVILIHGYKFSPRDPRYTPHAHILSLDPTTGRAHATSWPRKLGVGAGSEERPESDMPEPLCIALGWEARGSFRAAYRVAPDAGHALARLIRLLHRLTGGQPVDLMAHSLGARVALSALPALPAGAVGRIILLAPAELQSCAKTWLDCAAGRAAQTLNVSSGENLLFDRLLEWIVAPHRWGERAMGADCTQHMDHWTTLRIDDPACRAALSRLGFAIPPPDRRICHWSVYQRRGLFKLYRAILSGRLGFAELRAELRAEVLTQDPVAGQNRTQTWGWGLVSDATKTPPTDA